MCTVAVMMSVQSTLLRDFNAMSGIYVNIMKFGHRAIATSL